MDGLRIDSGDGTADGETWKDRIQWGGGVALPVQRAGIAIAGEEAWTEVGPEDKGAVFELEIPAGGTHLQTWFELEGGGALGAYYVYIEKVT